MTLGEKITRLTSLEGMTYKELSERSGVPYSTIHSCVKHGAKRMNEEYARSIARILMVDYEYLAGLRTDSETDSVLEDEQPFTFKTRIRRCLDRLDPDLAEELCAALPSYGSTLTMEEILDPKHRITPQDVTAVSKLLGVSGYYLLGLIDTPTSGSDSETFEKSAALHGSDVLTYSQTVKDEAEIALRALQETALNICYLPYLTDEEREMEADRIPERIMKIVKFLNANTSILQEAMKPGRSSVNTTVL